MWPAFLALGSFALYLATMCPTVWVEDSGELTSAGILLGIAHPPGYPLYCLLAKWVSVCIPMGSLAFRVNLLSALLASASVALVYRVCREGGIANCKLQIANFDRPSTIRNSQSAGLAAAAAALWAVSRTLWAQARFAEVYTLTALIVVVVWWVLQRMIKYQRRESLLLMSLVIGIGIVTHHTLFLLIPMVLVGLGRLVVGKRLTVSDLFLGFALFQLGVLMVVYLPLRSLVNVGTDWGNPETLPRLAAHLLRQQYGQLGTGSRMDHLGGQAAVYARYVLLQWTPWLIVLPVMGWATGFIGWRQATPIRRRLLVGSWLGWIGVGAGLVILINFPDLAYDVSLVHVFFIPSYFFLVLWSYDALVAWWPRRMPAILAVGCAVLPIIHAFGPLSLTRVFAGYDYGYNTLTTLPQEGILFVASDNQKFTSAYLKLAEGFRPDLAVYDETGCVFDHIVNSDTREVSAVDLSLAHWRVGWAALETGRPVAHAVGSNIAGLLKIPSQPEGLVSTFMPRREFPFWRRYNLRSVYAVRATDEYMLREALSQYELSWAEWWFQREKSDEAVKHLRQASAIAVDIAPAHNNLAITFANHQLLDRAEGELWLALELNPHYTIAQQNLEILQRMKLEQIKMKHEK